VIAWYALMGLSSLPNAEPLSLILNGLPIDRWDNPDRRINEAEGEEHHSPQVHGKEGTKALNGSIARRIA